MELNGIHFRTSKHQVTSFYWSDYGITRTI